MKIYADCGLSFKVWWISTFVFELLSSSVIGVLAVWVFLVKIGSNFLLAYSPEASTNYIVVNSTYEVLVTSWIILVLLSLSVARFIAASILMLGIKKSSAEMSQFWIAYKVFEVMMSLFLATASFNVSLLVKIAALTSLITGIVSSYFIKILYPELDRMRKIIVLEVDPKPKE